MISRIKGVMETGQRIEELSAQVSANRSAVLEYSREIEGFRKEVQELKTEIARFTSEASRFSETAFLQLNGVRKTNEDLKSEVYDFKLIKSEIKSRLVGDVLDEIRAEVRKGSAKLDTDVTRFNELKDELSVIVSKFRSVESEIAKFHSIAQQIKEADFHLARYARELEKNDREKLALMKENDNLKHLLAKERRGGRRP